MERTLDEDLAYGFRMLVDMAIRSLSESSFSDPTTAVQCIDRLHDGLRQLAVRHLDDGQLIDDSGNLRVTVQTMDWDAYVALAFDEIRLAGASSPQVTRRLTAALNDLIAVAPADRCRPLVAQRDLLHEAVRSSGRLPATSSSPSLPIVRASGSLPIALLATSCPEEQRPTCARGGPLARDGRTGSDQPPLVEEPS